MFNKVKGHPNSKVVIGVLSDRARVALLLGTTPDKLGQLLRDSVKPIQPTVVDSSKAKCQEVVYLATDPDFDIRKFCQHLLTLLKMQVLILH